MSEQEEESPLSKVLKKLNRSKKSVRAEDIWILANSLAEVIRQEKEIEIEELSAKTGISTYWIRKVWEGVGKYYHDIDIIDGRKFFVLRKARS